MEKLVNSTALKIVSYILIPIATLILIFNILHLAFLDEYSGEETEYLKTELFSNNYIYYVLDTISQMENNPKYKSGNYIEVEDNNKQKYYYKESDSIYSNYNGLDKAIEFVIEDKKNGITYTNMKSSNYEETINNIENQNIYWIYKDGVINTTIENLNENNIKYNYNFYYTSDEENINNYEIYTTYNEEKAKNAEMIINNQRIWEFMLENKTFPIYSLVISGTVLIVSMIYLVFALGHKKGKKEINLDLLDELPYEIICIICFTIVAIFLTIAINIMSAMKYTAIMISLIAYFICYIACAILGTTTIKRLKAKKFLKSFLIYKILRWCYRKIKKIDSEIRTKTAEGKKIFWIYIIFILLNIFLLSTMITGISTILLIALWVYAYIRIKKYIKDQEIIKEALEKIYKGEKDVYVDEKQLEGILKEMAIYVNDIAGGFSNAIEESLKSERLKTELITNVSHDIKTPLTSIINYVDLLKKEDIKNDKVKEYIEILDKKSQRLKKLTEDLVEASKVSSGNIKLNIEEINLKELINQTIGEFKDKFEKKHLIIETSVPQENIKIKADSRYMYRIIENLFSNITKYALDNTRVYIDINKTQKEVKINIKNISKERLNISSDELMQRFVRGDKSRYTEGSGLRTFNSKKLNRNSRRNI